MWIRYRLTKRVLIREVSRYPYFRANIFFVAVGSCDYKDYAIQELTVQGSTEGTT